MWKKKSFPLPHAIDKNQPKRVTGLNVNGKAIHLFEEYIGKKIFMILKFLRYKTKSMNHFKILYIWDAIKIKNVALLRTLLR